MLSEKESLYQQILADPDNDLVRLVYADLIEEQGQQEYANFIRHQINHPKEEYQHSEFSKIRRSMRCPERFYSVSSMLEFNGPCCLFYGIVKSSRFFLRCFFVRGFPEILDFYTCSWTSEISYCKRTNIELENTFFAQMVKMYPIRKFQFTDFHSVLSARPRQTMEYILGPELYSVLKPESGMAYYTQEKVETAALALARKWALLTTENK